MSENVVFKREKGYSHLKKYNIIYEWEIDEISTSIKLSNSSRKPCVLKSPKFSTGSSIADSWHLELTMRGKAAAYHEDHSGALTVELISDNKNNEIKAMYLIYMLDKNKKVWSTSCKFRDHPFSKQVFEYQPSEEELDRNEIKLSSIKYIGISQLFEYKYILLPNDTLTLCVNLTVYDDRKLSSIAEISLKTPQHHITDDLKDLLDTETKSDVVITVQNEKFRAHKLILGARSPVFDAMFSYDMREKKKNEIEISDVDPEIFKKLLEFIYTDEVGNLDDYAEELLEVANKYQIQSLKEMCAVSLSKTINVENAIPIMLFADRNNVKQLVKYAEKFIIINFQKIKKTKQYEVLKTYHPSLLLAILEKYAAGNKN